MAKHLVYPRELSIEAQAGIAAHAQSEHAEHPHRSRLELEPSHRANEVTTASRSSICFVNRSAP